MMPPDESDSDDEGIGTCNPNRQTEYESSEDESYID